MTGPASYAYFWGGIGNVRSRLANAIKDARIKAGITPEAFDDICGFGQPPPTLKRRSPFANRDSDTSKPPLPKSVEFESNHRLMRSEIFSVASVLLNLKIDEVLPLTLSEKERQEIAGDMKAYDGHQAEVYVLLLVLEEMDAAETSL